jgi:hypothetical protein
MFETFMKVVIGQLTNNSNMVPGFLGFGIPVFIYFFIGSIRKFLFFRVDSKQKFFIFVTCLRCEIQNFYFSLVYVLESKIYFLVTIAIN